MEYRRQSLVCIEDSLEVWGRAAVAESWRSSASPASWVAVDGIQLRKSASVGAVAGNRSSDHMLKAQSAFFF